MASRLGDAESQSKCSPSHKSTRRLLYFVSFSIHILILWQLWDFSLIHTFRNLIITCFGVCCCFEIGSMYWCPLWEQDLQNGHVFTKGHNTLAYITWVDCPTIAVYTGVAGGPVATEYMRLHECQSQCGIEGWRNWVLMTTKESKASCSVDTLTSKRWRLTGKAALFFSWTFLYAGHCQKVFPLSWPRPWKFSHRPYTLQRHVSELIPGPIKLTVKINPPSITMALPGAYQSQRDLRTSPSNSGQRCQQLIP